jgi:hypothetical protein
VLIDEISIISSSPLEEFAAALGRVLPRAQAQRSAVGRSEAVFCHFPVSETLLND